MLERRFRPPADGVARIPCRVCYRAVDLHPDFLTDDGEGSWTMNCPHCRSGFPVRMDDSMAARLERLRSTSSS
jgi:hypothetical protein